MGKPSKERLVELYYEREMSLRDMEDVLGVTNKTIRRYMDSYGLERRSISEARQSKTPSLGVDGNGYEQWSGCSDSPKQFRVHRLLAIADGADPYELFSKSLNVHHKNEIPWDNRPQNIEVMSKSEHQIHHSESITEDMCFDIRRVYRSGKSGYEIADDIGFSQRSVMSHVRGKCTHGHDVEPITQNDGGEVVRNRQS